VQVSEKLNLIAPKHISSSAVQHLLQQSTFLVISPTKCFGLASTKLKSLARLA
jgi:bifunctional pyridoxal-dependent enzyme with beta-cystathionase and maltose regulon repressor activities